MTKSKNASIYAKRASDSAIREIVRNLSEEEKQQDEFKNLVAYVELLRIRKKMENEKYKESKRLYARRKMLRKKQEQAQAQAQAAMQSQDNILEKDLENYQFDIFYLLPS